MNCQRHIGMNYGETVKLLRHMEPEGARNPKYHSYLALENRTLEAYTRSTEPNRGVRVAGGVTARSWPQMGEAWRATCRHAAVRGYANANEARLGRATAPGVHPEPSIGVVRLSLVFGRFLSAALPQEPFRPVGRQVESGQHRRGDDAGKQ